MGISRRRFVRVVGLAGAASVWSAQVLARGREAANAEAWGSWSPDFLTQAGSVSPKATTGQRTRIRLSSNENPVGPPKVALDALQAALAGGDAQRYPSISVQELVARLASHHGVGPESVVPGSGSGEILRMAVYASVSPTRPLVTAAPSFEEPTRYAELAGAQVIAVPVTQDLHLDLDAMLQRAKGAGLVFVCNPNNPTGTVHGAAAITDFVERVQRLSPDTTVLIDEAYHHYVEDPGYATAIPLALQRRNVVVTRTFSKLYGMAGLRLGYAIGQPETIAALRKHRLANSVNALVAPAAVAALGDDRLQPLERARNHEAREFTRQALGSFGYPSRASEANFIMVDIRRDVREFNKVCEERGVLIGRPFPPLMTHARISIGTMQEMTAAVEVFKSILASS
jgi:histidinol-phosphate aminotransferase